MKQPAPGKASRLASLASATSLLAVVCCYGTVGAVMLLSLVGVTVHLNEVLMTRVMTVVLAVALVGLVYSYRLHRRGGPLLLGLATATLLLWVFYGRYSRPLEALGFAGLIAAAAWDFRAKHLACPSATGEGNPPCP